MSVNRRRYRDDVDGRRSKIGRIGSEGDLIGGSQFIQRYFLRGVSPGTQRLDPSFIDIKPGHGAGFAEIHGEEEADLAKIDNNNGFHVRCHFP